MHPLAQPSSRPSAPRPGRGGARGHEIPGDHEPKSTKCCIRRDAIGASAGPRRRERAVPPGLDGWDVGSAGYTMYTAVPYEYEYSVYTA